MKLILVALLSFNSAYSSQIDYLELSDKHAVFKYLFQKHYELLNPDCHRNVFEGRGAKVYVAMGCQIEKLEIQKSQLKETMMQYKATYRCDDENYPFTAHCELKK